MFEALEMDIELFNFVPWKLRVSESFKSRLQSAFPDDFIWITLEDARAKIPSKARDAEMAEMIASFGAVQKRTEKEEHQVPFLQLIDEILDKASDAIVTALESEPSIQLAKPTQHTLREWY